MKDSVKKGIRNILHANIDFRSIRYIAEFPRDGVECISKLRSHCENMNFANKSIHDRLSRKLHIKEGSKQ